MDQLADGAARLRASLPNLPASNSEDLAAIQTALERAGVEFIDDEVNGGVRVRKMMYDAKQRADAAAKRAARLFERQQESERRVVDEEKRHTDMLAKTTRLRKQRLERDVAEAKAKEKAKPKRGARPSKAKD